jgi:hypothetical protein
MLSRKLLLFAHFSLVSNFLTVDGGKKFVVIFVFTVVLLIVQNALN